MKRQIFLLISTAILFSFTLKQKDKEIKVETNYNIETLAICFEIANNGFWNRGANPWIWFKAPSKPAKAS